LAALGAPCLSTIYNSSPAVKTLEDIGDFPLNEYVSDWETGVRVFRFFVIGAIGLAIASVLPPFFALLVWVAAVILAFRVATR
jgi:hypothetical protein